jgi:hypothetical protein
MELSKESIELRKAARRAIAEALERPDYVLPIYVGIDVLMCLVGSLQLSLRHPLNVGPSSQVVRGVIADIRARLVKDGFGATAEMMALGDDPHFDEMMALGDDPHF